MRLFRCLIVDDEDLILQRLEMIFREFDQFEIVGKAYSGKEALELAVELKPDIILTDIVMPAIDGIEMIERLKAMLPGPSSLSSPRIPISPTPSGLLSRTCWII
ncbi:response regulator [Paenibacillus sp. CC-CFT747]|nr:response regulator [Paenibacillus sp. CC-CFT747]